MTNILTIDGGGVRGIIPTTVLSMMESSFKFKSKDMFQYLAGTSVGSLLVLGIGIGYTPSNISTLLLDNADKAFPTSHIIHLMSRITRSFSGMGLSVPKYDGTGLDFLLKSIFKDAKMGDLSVNTMVTAYDVNLRVPVIFKSWKEQHKNLKIWEVARCSAAAPGYLPAHRITIGPRQLTCIDGGVVANNPIMCAISEAVRLGEDVKTIKALSLGTGYTVGRENDPSIVNWGFINWAPHIIDSLMDGASDVAAYQAHEVLPGRFFRIQMAIPDDLSRMDNADKQNIAKLITVARRNLFRPEMKKYLAGIYENLNNSANTPHKINNT